MWRMTDCRACSGEKVQVEKKRNKDCTWADKDEKQLGEDSESIQSTFYTTDNCSMSKVWSISNHKVS